MLKRFPPNKGGWEPKKRGIVLVGVMMVMPVLLLLLAVYTDRAMRELESVRRYTERTRALYLANAALAKATFEIVKDRDYRGSNVAYNLSATDYSEKWEYLVEGREVYPELEYKLKITMKGAYLNPSRGDTESGLIVIATPALGRSVLDYAISAGNSLKLNAGAMIGDPTDTDNDVYVGANMITPDETLYGPGTTYLYGKAELLTDVVQTQPPPMDPGPIEYGVEELFFPTFDLASLKAKAQANTSNPAYPGGMYFTVDTIFKDETIEGVVYVENAQMRLQGDLTVNGTLVCVGIDGIQCNANLVLHAPTTQDSTTQAPNVAVVQIGAPKLRFAPNKTIDVEGFIFCDATVQVDSDGTITGSIISEGEVEIGAKAQVYFRKIDAIELAREILVPGRWGLRIDAWVEDPDIKKGFVPTNPPPTVPMDPPKV